MASEKTLQLTSIIGNIERVIRGKSSAVELVVAALLARVHVLIEDVPGVGKTMLARALARSLDADHRRIQCTPDLLPSDVTGTALYRPQDQQFEFRRGPVFTNVLLADEINRATPRTQSAFLEAMEERQVSVDRDTHALPDPFFLIATQNPIELAGTFPLPEAQLDRFLVQVTLGYPDDEVEVEILATQNQGHPIVELQPCMTLEQLLEAQQQAACMFIHESLLRYIQQIVAATRIDEHVAHGSSPRGSLSMMHVAKSLAALRGDGFVSPDHVKSLAGSVLGHRIIVQPRSRVQGITGRQIVENLLPHIEVPVDFEPS